MVADIQILPRIKVIQRRLKLLRQATRDLRPFYADLAPQMVQSTRDRFRDQKAPTGREWKESKLAKRQKRKTLIKTGRLMHSIEATFDKRNMQVGTDVKYGHFFQQGGRVPLKGDFLARARKKAGKKYTPPVSKRLVQRKFLGISSKDRRIIAKTLTKHLREAGVSRG